jgi:tRNA(adenine34) deaminase
VRPALLDVESVLDQIAGLARGVGWTRHFNKTGDEQERQAISAGYHRGMTATMYMRRCLELAEIAALAGDTAVGALIVCGAEIVGEGVERTRAALDPSAHAEVEAIRQACQHLDTLDLRGCWLYSTVEPCVLCGYAIRRTGIAHVVYGVAAGQAGACTSAYAILADRDLEGWPQPPEVTGGVLAEECLAALRRTREPGQRS